MDKAKYILGNNITLSLCRNFLPVVKLHSLSHRPALGLYNLFLPSLIKSRVIRNVVNTKAYTQNGAGEPDLQMSDIVYGSECKSSSHLISGVSESAYVKPDSNWMQGTIRDFFFPKGS